MKTSIGDTGNKWTPKDASSPRVSRMKRYRLERAERMRRITTALNNGYLPEQIAESEGIKYLGLARILRESGFVYPGAGAGNYALYVKFRRVSIAPLDRLAAKWGVTRSEAASIIFKGALMDDCKIAEKAREKTMLPKVQKEK